VIINGKLAFCEEVWSNNIQRGVIMIITCQKCSTSYHLDETLLKPKGTKVRCTICKYIFKAYPPLETSLEHKQNYLASSQSETESQIDSSLDHTSEMEFPDDLAKALERNLNDDVLDTEEINGQLPSNLVFEVEDDEDIYFDEAMLEKSIGESDADLQDTSYEETFEEDDFNLSDSTYDLSDDDDVTKDDDTAEKDELTKEELELSPEDLDLVKGYSSNKYDFVEENITKDSQEAKEDFESEIKYEDEHVTLSEEDLDLGVSMATEALEETNTSGADVEDHDLSEAEEDKLKDIAQNFPVDQDKDNQSINIGGELDLEFGSELEDVSSEPESPLAEDLDEGLDMELSLDESEPLPSQANDNDNQDKNKDEDEGDKEELTLGIDFEEIFESKDLVNDTDQTMTSDSNEENLEGEISEQEDFDLDVDFENNLGEQSPNEDFDLSIDKDDDLDINFDFDESKSMEKSSENQDDDLEIDLDFDEVDVSIEGSEEDLDLTLVKDKDGNLDLNLDFDNTEEDHDELEKDLDLTIAKDDDFDLDLDLDGNEDEKESNEDLDLTLAKDDDFDLDLDFDGSEDEKESDEDLDLTLALDNGLNLGGELENTKDEPGTENNLDFKLDLDDKQENNEKLSSAETIDEDLEANFDIDESPEKISKSDDLDLSDIQELLDTDIAKEKKMISANESDNFDLSDLENELEDDQSDDRLADDQELELDFDIGSNSTETNEGSSEEEFSAELDLSEFEYLSDSNEKSPADDHFDTGDMELEFQIEENTPISPLQTQDESENEIALPEPSEETSRNNTFFQDAHSPESLEEYDEFDEHAYSSKKRDINKYLIVIFIIAALLGGGFVTYALLDGLDIRIPLLSEYLNPKTKDPGNLKLSTEDINSKFIDNATAGRMFVITGKVKSGYDKPRRFIRMTGKLYTKGKKIAKTEVVYCGNMASDDELTSIDITILKKRLADRFGGNKKANTTIQPGKTLPFMVIFSDLPKEQLEEFTIEVDQSSEIN
jgi:predicted Zn finger-like uncharacterized protein